MYAEMENIHRAAANRTNRNIAVCFVRVLYLDSSFYFIGPSQAPVDLRCSRRRLPHFKRRAWIDLSQSQPKAASLRYTKGCILRHASFKYSVATAVTGDAGDVLQVGMLVIGCSPVRSLRAASRT